MFKIPDFKQLRKDAGYKTIKDFAYALDMNPSTYSAYESGKVTPTIKNMAQIADKLDMSIDDLMEHKITGAGLSRQNSKEALAEVKKAIYLFDCAHLDTTRIKEILDGLDALYKAAEIMERGLDIG